MEYCNSYKYLGCYLNEFLDFNYTAEMQANSASRALSSIIAKMIKKGGFPYSVYSILYQSCVLSISQYGGEVFGFQNYDSHFKLHLRAIRAYLGLPKTVTSFGLMSEFDWLLPQNQSQLRMIQFLDRVFRLSSSRLVSKVYRWDHQLNEAGIIHSWSSEVKEILHSNNCEYIYDRQQIFPLKQIIGKLKLSMYNKQQVYLRAECENKPKLRTFVTFKDYATLAPHVGKPLTFSERKIISRLRLGILPLRIETARFIRPVVPEHQRVCYCHSGEVENEYHVLFNCSVYYELREAWLRKLQLPDNFEQLLPAEKLSLVLNKAENVRHTAQYLKSLLDLRSLLNKIY